MPRDSSAPKLRCAEPLTLPEEKPRAKPLRVLTPLTLRVESASNRTELSDSDIAAKLRALRTQSTLTQEDAAFVSRLSSRTIGRLERGETDLSHVRYVFTLLSLVERRERGGK
jgi:DNA-binding XRE family transcriptional regulator